MTTPVAFAKTSDSLVRFDKKLGLCFGWLCFSKKGGEDYIDAHGDHFPDDELLKAVDALMAKPAAEREINVEHAGEGRGSIATAQALTEDVAKALGIDTGGNYGVIGSFRPDAELLKSIEAGDRLCLSIEGRAYDVETVAKSAEGVDIAAAKHKRTMRRVELTKLAVVKAGAHAGAEVALIKSAASLLKRTPALTSAYEGHQHLIADLDEKDGYTSWETAAGDQYGHSHPWVRGEDGSSIHIGEANGHSHTLDTETPMPNTDLEKAQADLTTARAALAKSEARIGTLGALLLAACALPPEQAAYAKRLGPADAEAFLAKGAAERAELAKPVFVARSTGDAYYASDDPRLVEMAKSHDATHVELAKAREQAEAITFAKRADEEIPHLRGTAAERGAILKAVDAIPDEAVRKVALESLKGASQTMSELFKSVGHGGGGAPVSSGPESELDALAREIQKAAGGEGKCSFAKAYDDALATPRGQALYQQLEAAKRPRG